MNDWKMVPSSLTPEMWAAGARTKGLEASYEAMLASAPTWEPSDEDIERARYAYEANIGYYSAMRAAILAAVRGGS